MLNAFSRDIRSIRAQENIGVHSGASLAPKSNPDLYGPIAAVGLSAFVMSFRKAFPNGIGRNSKLPKRSCG
jgi:hypothetical protein